jgi:hypothetical protein
VPLSFGGRHMTAFGGSVLNKTGELAMSSISRAVPIVLVLVCVIIVITFGVIDWAAVPPTALAASTPAGAPCQPCGNWGQVKTCYSDTPHPCCSCEKQ